MVRGQRVAEGLNSKYEQELEDSYLQRKFEENPLLRMGAMMSKLPVMMAAGHIGKGSAAGGLMMAAGLMTAANRKQEQQRVVDYKRAEGTQKLDHGSTTRHDYLRSGINSMQSMANPLMSGAIGAQALGMLGSEAMKNTIAPGLMQGSIAARNPIMGGLQLANSTFGLTNALAGAKGEMAIDALGKSTIGSSPFGNLAMGSAFLPSTLMYGAGGALKGAGATAGMLGLGSTTVGATAGTGVAGALEAGGGLVGGLGDTLLQALAGAGTAGMIGGPILGALTSMALSKPINKMMAGAKAKATGNTIARQSSTVRPRAIMSSELMKKYTRTLALDNQVSQLAGAGQLSSFESIQLSYLSAIEKQVSVLGFIAEQQKTKEEASYGGSKVYDNLTDDFGFNDEAELTQAHSPSINKGLHNYWSHGEKKLTREELISDPMAYVRSSLSTGFLGLEKKMLQASAIFNLPGMIMGGKYSIGSKLRDIREKDTQGKIAEEMSEINGIPTSGIIAMETPILKLLGQGETADEKKLAIMGGTYELIRLSTFFLQDIRNAMGVTKEKSMLGKMHDITAASAGMEDTRGFGSKFKAGAASIVDKIPLISVLGSIADWQLRRSSMESGELLKPGTMAKQAAKTVMGIHGSTKEAGVALATEEAQDTIVDNRKEMLRATLNIENIAQKYTGIKGRYASNRSYSFARKTKKIKKEAEEEERSQGIKIMGMRLPLAALAGLTGLAGLASAYTGFGKEMLGKVMSKTKAALLAGAIEGAMIGSVLGTKGMMVGAVAGLVMQGTTLVVDKFINPKENPQTNQMSKSLLYMAEGAMAGAMLFPANPLVGALVGAVGALVLNHGRDAWEWFFEDSENTKLVKKNQSFIKERTKIIEAKEKKELADPKSKRSLMNKALQLKNKEHKEKFNALFTSDKYKKMTPEQKVKVFQDYKKGISYSLTKQEAAKVLKETQPKMIAGVSTTTPTAKEETKTTQPKMAAGVSTTTPTAKEETKTTQPKMAAGVSTTPTAAKEETKTTQPKMAAGVSAEKVQTNIAAITIAIAKEETKKSPQPKMAAGVSTTTPTAKEETKTTQPKMASGTVTLAKEKVQSGPVGPTVINESTETITNKTKVDNTKEIVESKKEEKIKEQARSDREVQLINQNAGIVDAIYSMRKDNAVIGQAVIDTNSALVSVIESGNGMMAKGVQAQISTASSSAVTAKKTQDNRNAMSQKA